jgi:hypothetical protein
MFNLICRHSKVDIKRAHPMSEFSLKQVKKPAWVDIHGVYNYITCVRCGTVLEAHHTETIFGEIQGR